MPRYYGHHLLPEKKRHGGGNTVCHVQSGGRGHHDFGEHVLDEGNIPPAFDKFDIDASSVTVCSSNEHLPIVV